MAHIHQLLLSGEASQQPTLTVAVAQNITPINQTAAGSVQDRATAAQTLQGVSQQNVATTLSGAVATQFLGGLTNASTIQVSDRATVSQTLSHSSSTATATARAFLVSEVSLDLPANLISIELGEVRPPVALSLSQGLDRPESALSASLPLSVALSGTLISISQSVSFIRGDPAIVEAVQPLPPPVQEIAVVPKGWRKRMPLPRPSWRVKRTSSTGWTG